LSESENYTLTSIKLKRLSIKGGIQKGEIFLQATK
jgi:hypothetical protein